MVPLETEVDSECRRASLRNDTSLGGLKPATCDLETSALTAVQAYRLSLFPSLKMRHCISRLVDKVRNNTFKINEYNSLSFRVLRWPVKSNPKRRVLGSTQSQCVSIFTTSRRILMDTWTHQLEKWKGVVIAKLLSVRVAIPCNTPSHTPVGERP